MKEIEFIPLKKVAGIDFGETREKVRAHLGSDYKEFKKTRFSKNTSDAYEAFHVYYASDDSFEAIEVFPEVMLKTSDTIMPTDYSQALEWLKIFDPATKVDDCGATSCKCGISIYAPDGKIESIMIAKEGYYTE